MHVDNVAREGCRPRLILALLVLGSLCTIVALIARSRLRQAGTNEELPPGIGRSDGPWPTPSIADAFDYPLQPPQDYGPYAQGISGFRAIDTRFGMQNPALGNRSNCFRDSEGNAVPFSELYHAGVDLFSLDRAGQFLWGGAAGDSVHAVADGIVVASLNAGAEGQIMITQHLLPDQSRVYAVYWHVARLRVAPGQAVKRGQTIAMVHDQGLNSHLHWEMRTFLDGSNLFPEGTAGAQGSCNGHVAAVGYTWDDTPERAQPEFYGYLDPLAFVASHQ